MNQQVKIIIFSLLAIFSLSFYSCLSVAKLSDLPQTAEVINFNKIADSEQADIEKFWTFNTVSEYYIKSNSVNDSLIFNSLKTALINNGFSVKLMDRAKHTILAKSGLKGNEWNTIVGIYYNIGSSESEIYIKCKITQDITGGLREDRAKKIGDVICNMLENCKEAYRINSRKSSP